MSAPVEPRGALTASLPPRYAVELAAGSVVVERYHWEDTVNGKKGIQWLSQVVNRDGTLTLFKVCKSSTMPSPALFANGRPRLLDLFCCEGGASAGYQAAGFEVVGVDISPQPNYPYEFHQGDALSPLVWLSAGRFDAIHASPPCQSSTTMSNRWRGAGGKADSHENLIDETRALLEATGLPYVIENVPGARKWLRNPAVLTGEMFGLNVHRPRLFETNWLLLVPPKPPAARDTVGVYGKAHDGRLLWQRKDGSEQHAASSLEEAREAMGMPWASWRGCAEAIPPAYTELIGAQLLQHALVEAVA